MLWLILDHQAPGQVVTSALVDPRPPGTWQGSHHSTYFHVTGMTGPGGNRRTTHYFRISRSRRQRLTTRPTPYHSANALPLSQRLTTQPTPYHSANVLPLGQRLTTRPLDQRLTTRPTPYHSANALPLDQHLITRPTPYHSTNTLPLDQCLTNWPTPYHSATRPTPYHSANDEAGGGYRQVSISLLPYHFSPMELQSPLLTT